MSHPDKSRIHGLATRFKRRSRGEDRLLANPAFRNLWLSESISQVGSQISLVAIPLLAVLHLDANAFEMGLLTTAGSLPYLLFGLVAGAWVDRLDPKRVMVVADVARAALLCTVPLVDVAGMLTFWVLLMISFLVGTLSVAFNTAYGALLPAIVRRGQLADANGLLMGSQSVAQIVGPAMGGLLVSLISAPLTMLINATTFFGSGWFIGRIPQPPLARHATHERHLGREIREGLIALISSPVLRSITLSTSMNNLAGFVFLSVYVLYMKADLHLSDQGVGLVYAAGGVGAAIGSFVAAPLAKRLGTGTAIVWSSVAFGAGGVTVPLAILAPAHALPLVVFAEFFQWLALLVFNTNRIALRQALTPQRLQGRVAASSQVLTMGMQPVGAFIGGAIGSIWSVQAALIVGVVGMFAAFLFVWFSPTRAIQEIPAEAEASLREAI